MKETDITANMPPNNGGKHLRGDLVASRGDSLHGRLRLFAGDDTAQTLLKQTR